MNKIRENRRKMGLTQIELAKALNISQASLSGYETGRIEPDVKTMRKMSDLFGVTLDELFGDQINDVETQPNDISEIEFALSGEIRDLSEAEKQDVLDYVRFKRAQRAKASGGQ